MRSLFEDENIAGESFAGKEELVSGAFLLRGFALPRQEPLLAAVKVIAQASPFRHMITPGGFRMSVAMTNCGSLGWITDRRGYRYDAIDPETGRKWPAMPPEFSQLAVEAAAEAGFSGFYADACLINRYAPGTRRSRRRSIPSSANTASI